MTDKLSSIVMPTFNRAWILPFSLSLIKDQVLRNADDVELIICNNAATDDTENVLKNYESEGWFKFINYTDHKEIGISISRSIDNATGKFFLLWGDDDIPNPRMIDILVDALKRHPDVSGIHFNRMQGYADSSIQQKEMEDLRVFYKTISDPEKKYESSKLFSKDCFRGMAFLSVNLLSREAWEKGKQIYTAEHLGFEFLAPFLYGLAGKKSLYISYPLCIQRCLKRPVYREKWPAYLYVGIPRALKDLEKYGVIDDWKEHYRIFTSNSQFRSSFIGYVNNIVYWATRDKKYYVPLVKEINESQTSVFRKLVTYTVCLPNWLNKFNRTILGLFLKVIGKE